MRGHEDDGRLAPRGQEGDEHGARVRIANLGSAASGEGNAASGAVRGAQVSLSFSKLAAAVRVGADEAVAASRTH